MNCSFVSVAPEKASAADGAALTRIKQVQAAEKKTWRGIDVRHTGRPGTSSILKKRRAPSAHDRQMADEEAFETLLWVINRMKEVDEERPYGASAHSSTQNRLLLLNNSSK